jgi:hypothetical protein
MKRETQSIILGSGVRRFFATNEENKNSMSLVREIKTVSML